MRVLHLLKHTNHSNGNVNMAVDLACAQRKAGHEPIVGAHLTDNKDVLSRGEVQMEDVAAAGGMRSAHRSARRLAQVIRRTQPDVIHVHMMSSAVLAYLPCKILRIPMVATVHNSFDAHSVIMRLGDRVVAVSEAERTLLESRGFSPNKMHVVLNGTAGSERLVNSEFAARASMATPSICVVSGLHARKAVDNVIIAFSKIRRDFPQWHLNIAGDGPDRAALEGLAADVGGNQVHFLGPLDNPMALFRESEIFVTATLADPCPLAVSEAREAGCAIVATNVGGIPEILDKGLAGILVAPSSVVALEEPLRKLLTDQHYRESWRRQSLDHGGYFSTARVARQYEEIYRSAISQFKRNALSVQ